MSKKIIVIITVISIVMTIVILPISLSAAVIIPNTYVKYQLTYADFQYLYENDYISLYYFIDGDSADTGVSNDGWTIRTGIWNKVNFYTPYFVTSGTFNISMSFHLPFEFYLSSFSINASASVYASGNYPLIFSNSDTGVYASVSPSTRSYELSSYFNGYPFGASQYSVYRDLSDLPLINSLNGTIDSFGISISSTSPSCVGGFFDIDLSLYIPARYLADIKEQSDDPSWLHPSDPGGDPSDPGGDPSDPGGDPSDPGTGSVDFTPLIGYLESLNSENQSTVDTIQSKTDTAIEGLSSSSEQAMDFFNDSEALKTDIIGSTEDFDSFIDSLDLSEEISVTYEGDSYSFDPMQGLDLIGGRMKSLFSFPLFYFILFMLFFLALASYVIYGRA